MAKLLPVCFVCGGSNIVRDAAAKYDPTHDEWSLACVHDQATCEDCNSDCDYYMRPEEDNRIAYDYNAVSDALTLRGLHVAHMASTYPARVPPSVWRKEMVDFLGEIRDFCFTWPNPREPQVGELDRAELVDVLTAYVHERGPVDVAGVPVVRKPSLIKRAGSFMRELFWPSYMPPIIRAVGDKLREWDKLPEFDKGGPVHVGIDMGVEEPVWMLTGSEPGVGRFEVRRADDAYFVFAYPLVGDPDKTYTVVPRSEDYAVDIQYVFNMLRMHGFSMGGTTEQQPIVGVCDGKV